MSDGYVDGEITDETYEPTANDKEAAARWQARIDEGLKLFRDYQQTCNRIDRLYANLKDLSNDNSDRQFQLFWANIEVLKPSIYARPPVPVVVPRFQDKRPLYQVSSELLERSVSVEFDLTNINQVMLSIRDDLALVARGVPWVRYEDEGDEGEHCVIEHIDRVDFLHEAVRKWAAVGWVARRAWMTKDAMRERFQPVSGDTWKSATYTVEKEAKRMGAATDEVRCAVWEIWSKTDDEVLWIAEGCESTLDRGKPHLKLRGFFPCPRPAYGTLQPGTLQPVPDVLFYRDQLEEINALTRRMASLTESLRVRGFYPAGGGDIGDAVEKAMADLDDRKVMVPINNWAAFSSGGASSAIIWLPVDQVAQVILQCVELRRQLIEDVYQIMGLSDIMRGSTEASETATAQQIKAQYGSVRIRDKQAEMARVARDLVSIVAEIQAENYSVDHLIEMAQLEVPTDADVRRQVKQIEQSAQAQIEQAAQQVMSNPEAMQQAQADPQAAQQAAQQAIQQVQQQAMEQIAQLEAVPTVEKIRKFLKDQKIRSFVLDIETDSTIQPDEQAEKEQRAEFMQVLGGTLQQLIAMVSAVPESAPFAAEVLKFSTAPYRAGRALDGAIEQFAEQMANRQPQPNPEQEAAAQKAQMEAQKMQADIQMRQMDAQARQQEIQAKTQLDQAKAQADMAAKQADIAAKQEEARAKLAQIEAKMAADAQKTQADLELAGMDIQIKELDIQAKRQDAVIRSQEAQENRLDRATERATAGDE
jgi:hypothetical protein